MTALPAIKVVINGALGKMGRAISEGLVRAPETELVGGVDVAASSDRLTVSGAADVPLSASVASLLEETRPDVLIEFSTAQATLPAVRAAAERGVSFVVGTTGHGPEAVAEMRSLADTHGVGGAVAPNFALGAVLLMDLAQRAARYFDYAEIIEMHHETKIDAPSGTAALTARQMAAARGRPFERNVPTTEAVAGTRAGSVEGITIHSVRLPGAMAHQEVILGTAGQTLTIRHDTINRDCYLPGILIAVKHVVANKGLVEGLGRLMGLGE